MKLKSAPCSDWFRNWRGYIGKIHVTEDGLVWKGHWQGRHGQKGQRIVSGIVIHDGVAYTSCPVNTLDVKEALRILGYDVQVKPLE